MKENLRYVTRRAGKRGSSRYYWQRRGYPLTRLPDDLIERITLVERLNDNADALKVLRRAAEPPRGTVAWVVARYQASEEYSRLAPNTVIYYDRILREIEALGSTLPFATAWSRRNVIDYIDGQRPSSQHLARAVLKNLFKVARYYGLVEVDHTTDLRIRAQKPRDRLWSDEEVTRFLEVAELKDEALVTAFYLLRYTAQRPGDVLRMTWADYKPGSPGHIRVRQEKTKALLDVPVHADLAARLDALPRSPGRIVTPSRGKTALRYHRFAVRFRQICREAGIDAQARDLRRTAMMHLAIAGATVPEIASVSGHTIDATQRILETYLPRNTRLAEAAIARLPRGQTGTGV